MKRIATIVANGHIVGLVHGADAPDQSITVNGRIWKFDFDRRLGPVWFKADGTTERKCQNPAKQVWDEFTKWHQAWLAKPGSSATAGTKHSMKKQPSKKRKAPAKNRVAVRSSALAKARGHWLESAEGKRCLQTGILHDCQDHQYLRNRLELAFLAGANWMERHKRGRPKNER